MYLWQFHWLHAQKMLKTATKIIQPLQKPSGYTKVYVIGRQINIAITADDTIKESALEQAHESIFKVYAENMHAWAVIDELKVEKDSKVTVNGTEMY